jgi:two-component system CheB/CheR fusion protein
MDMIDRQVAQLSRLVDDLLDISRITRGKVRLRKEPLDLRGAVLRGIETVRPVADARRHELKIELPSTPVEIVGDETRLAQVVSNVLHNAAKFTPEGGHVSLRLVQDDESARVVVRDDGAGIAPDMLDTIFEVFTQADSTVDRAQGGLGIGLALVRSVVEMHGGRVEVQSEGPGKGSEFAIVLPLAPGVAEGPVDRRPTSKPPRTHGPARRVLVVDDNVDSAESLMLLLRELGHDVRMVTQGRRVLGEALDFRPDVILLDIGLPDLNGYEVAEELRRTRELAGVLLVALTGYGQTEHRHRSREVGFDHHWVKPLDLARLRQALTSLPARLAALRPS